MSAVTITTEQIIAGDLPADATGVTWLETDYTECRAHLLDPSWAQMVDRIDAHVGVVRFDEIECEACLEDSMMRRYAVDEDAPR